MKKIGLIQSQVMFTDELRERYLGDISLLTSSNIDEIYSFIRNNAKVNSIFKYVLHIDSGVLDQFIDFIHNRKQNFLSTRRFLSKCTFVATISNADSIRAKNIEKETGIYFSISPLSKLLVGYNSIPRERHLFIVSDRITPFFNQVMEVDFKFKYRLSNVTVEIINEFIRETNGSMSIFLNDSEEVVRFVNLVVQSQFRRAIYATEINNFELFRPLFTKVSLILSDSSGSGICGNIKKYADLNNFVLYENTAAVLVNSHEYWDELINNHVISKELADYGVKVKFDVIPKLNN